MNKKLILVIAIIAIILVIVGWSKGWFNSKTNQTSENNKYKSVSRLILKVEKINNETASNTRQAQGTSSRPCSCKQLIMNPNTGQTWYEYGRYMDAYGTSCQGNCNA